MRKVRKGWRKRYFPFLLLVTPYSLLLLLYCSPKAPSFDSEAAFHNLLTQCSFGPRTPGSEGHRACGEYLRSRLNERCDRVVEQHFWYHDSVRVDSLPLTNYIGIINPAEGKRVLLAAHWDTRPWADRDPDPANRVKPILGANDGASGVAVLLELARQFKTRKPPVGVDIVFFDGEDSGQEGNLGGYFLGSRYFAEHLGTYRPAYGILLDMVGDKNLSIPLEANSLRAAPGVMEKIWNAARLLRVSAFLQEQGPTVADDHLPLLAAGIPMVDLIDFDYPAWHTLGDKPEKTSSASLAAVGKVISQVVYSER